MTYVGIDVSKDTFTVAYSSDKNSKTKTFKNTVKGIHEFIQTVSKEDTHCVASFARNQILKHVRYKRKIENGNPCPDHPNILLYFRLSDEG